MRSLVAVTRASETRPRALANGVARFLGLVGFFIDRYNSVIVNDLDPRGPFRCPHVANAILIVDPDRILSSPVALERFPPIARRETQRVRDAVRLGGL